MNSTLVHAFGALIAIGIVYLAVRVGRLYFRWRGQRLVICPETRQPEAVALDAREAAIQSALMGKPFLLLKECSRWPERQNCGQECVRQIELAPEDCLVRNIVAKWYADKKCAYCHKPFVTADDMFHHGSALMGPDRRTFEWCEIPAEKLPEVFATYQPVCWSCHVAESFRKEFPELVVDRPRH